MFLNLEVGALLALPLNYNMIEEFQIKRSIRQGCPLAPLLFAIIPHPLILSLEVPTLQGEIIHFYYQMGSSC